MSRSYKIRAKVHRVYSVDEVRALYGICRNTLSNWVSSGLSPSPGPGSQLFRGAELNRFHMARRAQGRRQMRIGQFYCLRCKVPVFPIGASLELQEIDKGGVLASADCSECSGIVMKRLGQTESDRLREALDTNTNLADIDEAIGPTPVGIGKIQDAEAEFEPSWNDRILHSWQDYAGRYDPKTVDAHLTSIRDFEASIEGMSFSQVTPRNVAAYRNQLIERGAGQASDGGLSASTIRHRASHLAAFFRWLCTQEGYRRLDASLPEYFALPRKQMAKAVPPPTKDYPTIEEAEAMVQAMPSRSPIQRRNQAMVACAFLTGLRASALLSMRLKHLDTETRKAIQDGREMRAKNGKSFTVHWFPVPESFAQIAMAWKAEVIGFGYGPQDALFPDGKHLVLQRSSSATIPILKANGPLTQAFQEACTGTGKAYTPHAARHCLKAHGDRICTSSEALKAWSLNLGHDSVVITETHYGKMAESDRIRILDGLSLQGGNSDDEKELMLSYFSHELVPGTSQWKRAKALIRQREEAKDAVVVVE